ncbi:MAG: protease inhibitor I42 family protein [Candidatus Omnitrophica bacterium]|nr:protease inhibitor I42 family protein [Candidatus Omnitrophota bacterium]
MIKSRLILFCAVSVLAITVTVFSFVQAAKNTKDSSNKIQVEVGKQFAITLESNMTTGYQWQFARALDNTLITLVSLEYKRAKPKLVGSGGKEIWTFKALKEGKATISFQYVRPWEKGKPAAKSKDYTVLIHK